MTSKWFLGIKKQFLARKKIIEFYFKKIRFSIGGTLTELLKNDDFVEKNWRNSQNNFFLVQKRLENTQSPSLGCQEPISMHIYFLKNDTLFFSFRAPCSASNRRRFQVTGFLGSKFIFQSKNRNGEVISQIFFFEVWLNFS